jgi:preprotein translocase subunit SecG
MEVLLVVLIVIVSVVLIGVVLIQNPKGGGMSSNIAGGNQMFGVKKTTDILEKGTWYLIIALVGLSIFLNVTIAGSSNQIIEEVSKLKDVATPTTIIAPEEVEAPAELAPEAPANEPTK